jgi:lysophospholipase L1-like esterase
MEFSVNDSVTRFGCSPEQARRNLEAMIDRIVAANPACEIVLMTTSPADKYPEGHTSHRTQIEAYHGNYREVAAERGFLLIDLFPIWQSLKASDPARYAAALPDTIHPSPLGEEEIVAPAILKGLGLSEMIKKP